MKIKNKGWNASSATLWITVFIVFILIFNSSGAPHESQNTMKTASWALPLAFVVVFVLVLYFKLRRELAVLNLLRDGKIDRFIAEMDQRLAKMKNPKHRDVIKINKSAGLCDKGSWPEAIALLDEMDFASLNPLRQLAYINNKLFALMLMGKLDEARRFKEEHASMFQNPISNARIRDAVSGTLAVYEIYFGDIRQAEIKLNELMDKDLGRTSKAQHCYFLGVIAMRRGDQQACRNFFKKAEDLGPNTFVPARVQDELKQLVH